MEFGRSSHDFYFLKHRFLEFPLLLDRISGGLDCLLINMRVHSP